MKKTLYAAMLLLGLSMMATSCMSTYNVNHQKSVYEAQMTGSVKTQVIMDKIPIYYSDAEVGKKFTVMYYCSYEPLTIPILRTERSVLQNSFYKKAVTTAEKLQGDAIIIDTKNSFRIIKTK